jgi:hypothetical protein
MLTIAQYISDFKKINYFFIAAACIFTFKVQICKFISKSFVSLFPLINVCNKTEVTSQASLAHLVNEMS